MLIESMPIETYIASRFNDKAVLTLIENWRVEPEFLQKTIITYFREMGIFSVTPTMEKDVRVSILYLLQNSPDIFSKVRKAEHQELLRRQSRRSDDK